jgi:hypothetical protein
MYSMANSSANSASSWRLRALAVERFASASSGHLQSVLRPSRRTHPTSQMEANNTAALEMLGEDITHPFGL